ncbi:MAG: hypothetical protein K9G62_08985 [Alphaproteobacteria bacterium]|nr:hypothetical protein [Alphaproteobacteria bacterium]
MTDLSQDFQNVMNFAKDEIRFGKEGSPVSGFPGKGVLYIFPEGTLATEPRLAWKGQVLEENIIGVKIPPGSTCEPLIIKGF